MNTTPSLCIFDIQLRVSFVLRKSALHEYPFVRKHSRLFYCISVYLEKSFIYFAFRFANLKMHESGGSINKRNETREREKK